MNPLTNSLTHWCRRRRTALLLAALATIAPCAALGSAALVSAQDAPTPPHDRASAISIDVVVEPLMIAAEADARESRFSLAASRALLVQQAAGRSSRWFVRAEGVRLVAAQQLGGTAPVESGDVVVAPLLAAAETDAREVRHELAIARLDLALSQASAGGQVWTRAAALRTASVAALPRIVAIAPPAGSRAIDAPVSAATTTSAASVSTEYGDVSERPPEFDDQAFEVPPAAEVTAPSDPTRRGDGEIVELAITAGLFGAYAGFWIPFASGLEGGSGRNAGAANTVYSLTLLAGGAGFALGALALDSGSGLRTGIAPAMSSGLRLGTAAGFLAWGAADRMLSPTQRCDAIGGASCSEIRAGWSERTALPFAFGLTGLLAGAVVGFGLEPTTDQVRFVELQGTLWGSGIGVLLASAVQQGDADDSPRGFALTLGGMSAGILTTAILAGLGMNVSQTRGWLMSIGFAAGLAAAALVSLVVNGATGEMAAFPITFGGIGAATGLVGLIVAGILTDGMDAPAQRTARTEQSDFEIRPSLSPLPGGASLGVNGTF